MTPAALPPASAPSGVSESPGGTTTDSKNLPEAPAFVPVDSEASGKSRGFSAGKIAGLVAGLLIPLLVLGLLVWFCLRARRRRKQNSAQVSTHACPSCMHVSSPQPVSWYHLIMHLLALFGPCVSDFAMLAYVMAAARRKQDSCDCCHPPCDASTVGTSRGLIPPRSARATCGPCMTCLLYTSDAADE